MISQNLSSNAKLLYRMDGWIIDLTFEFFLYVSRYVWVVDVFLATQNNFYCLSSSYGYVYICTCTYVYMILKKRVQLTMHTINQVNRTTKLKKRRRMNGWWWWVVLKKKLWMWLNEFYIWNWVYILVGRQEEVQVHLNMRVIV